MIDTTKLSYAELGRLILTELVGGEPTVERNMYWYAQQRQKQQRQQRQQIRLVSDAGAEQP